MLMTLFCLSCNIPNSPMALVRKCTGKYSADRASRAFHAGVVNMEKRKEQNTVYPFVSGDAKANRIAEIVERSMELHRRRNNKKYNYLREEESNTEQKKTHTARIFLRSNLSDAITENILPIKPQKMYRISMENN